MPEHDLDTLLGWRGRTVLDRKGDTIGKVGDLYLDEATDRPAYAGVRTGLFGRHESILPLAELEERDGDLVAPYDAELVRDAPSIDPDGEALDDEAERRLAHHYDMPATRAQTGGAGGATALGGDEVRAGARGDEDADAVDDAGVAGGAGPGDAAEGTGEREATGRAAVDAAGEPAEVVRSEEEVVAGRTPLQPKERVRIRKVLVTDNVERTVPVRREEVRLETDPPPEGDVESVQDAGPARDER